MDPLTIGTFTIAAVVIFETAGNGVIITAEENIFNVRAGGDSLEDSRRNKTDIRVRTVSRARRVPQNYFDQSTMFATGTASSWGEEVPGKWSIHPTCIE